MFTGIVEEVGRVASAGRSSGSVVLTVEASVVTEGTRIGDSISVSGACLTVTGVTPKSLTFTAVAETLRRTTLADVRPGMLVNLERAMAANGRLGGHFVQGHVDGIGAVLGVRTEGNSRVVTVAVDDELSSFLVEKGSVAVDGVSLTIASLRGSAFSVAVIPHTLENTTLGSLGLGDLVNVETDIIGRYVAKFLRAEPEGLSEELLRRAGFA
jgi:riboflavin synthase